MASDADNEMKPVNCIDIDNYRKLVRHYLSLHVYHAALFWADKVVALTSGNPRDIYWLAQCMFAMKQYHRATHLIRSHELEKKYVLCNQLTVQCLLKSNELSEALKVLNSLDLDSFLQNTPTNLTVDVLMFDDTPKRQVQSSVLLLKGKILEGMDNYNLASECYKQALQCDVYCFEAFEALIKHQMLSAAEERELLNCLPLSQQCNAEEAEILILLYESKLKKYHTPSAMTGNKDKYDNLTNSIKSDSPKTSITVHNISNYSSHTHVFSENNKEGTLNKMNPNCEVMTVETTDKHLLVLLQNSLDLAVSQAECLYYNCEYQQCNKLLNDILKQDPYHESGLPIYIACQVELRQSDKLFTLAHNLVDLYPTMALSWFAVGCYYYIIGKSDSARRFLAKATSLNRLFGPGWLAYGHSFAIENEHDQAMAAYFKASQLMKGCHLPLLYIGLECGLTNNVRLAEKFFQQAQSIAPEDPFVMHEMGVIAFQNLDYKSAEKHFKNALTRIKKCKDTFIPEKWEPLLNNLGHTCRKLKKYDEALQHHQQALVLVPQSAGTYSAIAYVYALMGSSEEAVDWFHKALGLRRDDTFSTTMLNYVIEQFSEEQPPYPDAPQGIPDFNAQTPSSTVRARLEQSRCDLTDMSIEVDSSDILKE